MPAWKVQYGGMRARHAQNLAIRRSRERPAPVTIRYVCPRCGGKHPVAKCRAQQR